MDQNLEISATSDLQQQTILIVDDNPTNRDVLVTLLGHKGHRLLEAADGAEALERARAEPPDLIITDILMPTMDGYEFVRQLRTEPALAQTPIIFYTAHYLEREARALAEACGVTHILMNPSKATVVLQTVEAALSLAVPTAAPPPPKTFGQEHLRLLTNKLSQNVDELRLVNERLSALIDINLQLASEGDPQRLFDSFCRAARKLFGAKWATVSILDEDKRALRYFFSSGLEAETVTQLDGLLPQDDVLTTMLAQRRPYRVNNPGGNPERVNFPQSYPSIHTLLAAPIMSPTYVYGWLCLIDRVGAEEFSEEDERLAVILAAQVGQTYENGRLYAELQDHAQALEQEVAERKRAEETLRESEERFRLLVEGVKDYAIFMLDLGGRIISWNAGVERIYGYQSHEIIGCHFSCFHPQNGLTASKPESELTVAAAEGRFEVEDWHVHKDGSQFWANVVITALFDTRGNLRGFSKVVRDMTEHRRAEEQFRSVVEASPNAIILVSGEGKISLVNAQTEVLFGYSREELLGQRVEMLVPAPFQSQHRYVREAFSAAPQARPMGQGRDLFGLRKDGSQVPVEIRLSPISTSEGIFILASIIDITGRKQGEEALATERQRLRTLIDNLPDFIYLKDTQGRFIIGNTAVARLMGVSRSDELIGKTDFDFYPPELAGQYYANEQAVIASGQPVLDHEEPLWDMTGKKGWISSTQVPLRDSQGLIAGLVGIGRDITERKQQEEEIRHRNRELTLLNEVIAACAAGREPEWVLETTCRELALAFNVPQVTVSLLNEEKTTTEVTAEYRAKGRPSALGATLPVNRDVLIQYALRYEGPLIIQEADSNARPASFRKLLHQHGIASLLLLPLRVGSQVIGALSLESPEARRFLPREIDLAWSVADQVAGALARAHLIQVQQRLSTVVEQATESVIITDTEGSILYVNPAFERISGYSRAEIIGQTSGLLKSGQHDATFYQEMWATISAGQVWHGRFVNRQKDGTLYTNDATITPIRNDADTIINYVSVQRDVTRELQLEEQYHHAQKMDAIGRLSGGIAHDFNNLLVVITGYSELLLSRYLDADSPLRKYAEEIKQAGDRAAGLTQQLLAFSRKQVLQPKILDLNEVVTSMEKMLQRLIGEDIELLVRRGPGLGQVKADHGQLEQVILNLAVNARDAMLYGGKLTIETTNIKLDEIYTHRHLGIEPGRYVLLAVSDTGIGMDEATLARIFEPFFTTKEPGKGIGLGLATVYGIVKQSGGDIWVYSELGQGSTFKIYLPRVDETIPALESEAVPLELQRGTETILVVEDEITVRALIRQALEISGYTILEAPDGDEALLLAEQYQNPVHLLLTDVVMPHMSGRELAARLTLLHPEMKVLYMSGYTDEAIAHHGVLEPGLFFLQKPFTPNTLASKVREILNTPDPNRSEPNLAPVSNSQPVATSREDE